MYFENKVALVTGAAEGIGFSIVKEFLLNGAKAVIATDINVTLGEENIKTLQKEFSEARVLFKKLDVTSEEEFEDAFKLALNKYGRIDILVNNAGILGEDDYVNLININLIGTIRGVRLGLKYMRKDKGGHGGSILNVASISSVSITPYPVYSISKKGALGIAVHYGKQNYYEKTNVRVMNICPGYTTSNILLKDNTKEDEICLEEVESLKKLLNIQSPEYVGKAAAYIINNGESATTWIINEKKLYEYVIPEWTTCSKLVIDYSN